MQKVIFTLVLILAVAGLLGAQVAQTTSGDITVYGGSSGSPYSAFGIGDILSPGFGQINALSGTGIGLSSPYFVNTTNPAALTSIERPISMIFDFGLNFGATLTKGSETSPFQIDGGLSAINLWFRFNRNWSSNLGIHPYSKVGYNILDERYDLSAGGAYSMVYTGKGGVNRLYWGNAFQLTPHLSIGGNVNLLFGSIEEAETFVSESSLGSFSVTSKNYLRGAGIDAGVQYYIPLGRKKLVLGFTYASPVDLSSEKSTQLLAQQDTLDQVEVWDKAFKIPRKLGAGFSLQASKRLTLAGDYIYQPWSEGRLNEGLQLLDTKTVSFGAEYIPTYDKYLGYYQQTLLRAGFKWQNAYLEVDEKQVNEWQLSVGLGLPFNKFRNHLNLSYTYLHRGDISLLEIRHQLSFQVSLRDVWFQRSKIK